MKVNVDDLVDTSRLSAAQILVGIANAIGRSASIIVPLLIGALFAEAGIPGVLAAMSGVLLTTGVVATVLGTETGIPRSILVAKVMT